MPCSSAQWLYALLASVVFGATFYFRPTVARFLEKGGGGALAGLTGGGTCA